MKIARAWSQPRRLLSLFTIAIGSVATAAPAIPGPGNPLQIAQITSSCRRVIAQQGLAVREQPNPDSRRLGGAPFNSQITITENAPIKGPDGRLWLKISAPYTGYVASGYPESQSNLGLCSDTGSRPPANPTPNPSNLCRQVEPRVAPRGLVVRADASRVSAARGTVPVNGKVSLVENYRLVLDKNGENRNWVEISTPVRGYVSAQSLIMCR